VSVEPTAPVPPTSPVAPPQAGDPAHTCSAGGPFPPVPIPPVPVPPVAYPAGAVWPRPSGRWPCAVDAPPAPAVLGGPAGAWLGCGPRSAISVDGARAGLVDHRDRGVGSATGHQAHRSVASPVDWRSRLGLARAGLGGDRRGAGRGRHPSGAAGWLFVLCVMAAAVAGSLAVAGGRRTRGPDLGRGLSLPGWRFLRSIPWVAKGMAAARTTASMVRTFVTIVVTIVLPGRVRLPLRRRGC